MTKKSVFVRAITQALVAALLIGAPVSTLFAQVPTGPASNINAAMMKLFGDHTSFTSSVDVRVLDQNQKEITSMPLVWLMLDGNVRLEMDMNLLNSAETPAAALSIMKQMGLDKLSLVVRTDKKIKFTAFPGLQSYTELPMTAEEIADSEKTYKIQKSKIGKETVGGHSCEKDKVTLTPDKGAPTDALVWYASDLKQFPVQIRLGDQGNTVTFTFKDVKLVKPEARLFEAPEGMTKYENADKLAQAALLKRSADAK